MLKANIMKICSDCKRSLPISSFYTYRGNKIFARCKRCYGIFIKQNKRDQKYASLPESRQKYNRTYAAMWASRNKVKRNIHNRVYKALRKGLIVKPNNCYLCGKEGIRLQAHHPNYEAVFNIIWLCHSCHALIHIHNACPSVETLIFKEGVPT